MQDTLPKSITFQEIQESTKDDPELIKLISYVQQGKLQECRKDPLTNPFVSVFTELSYIEGIVMRGNWMVIPKKLRKRVVDICHKGHMGIVNTKQLLRSKVWFRGIDRCVETVVADCVPCQACTRKTVCDPLEVSPLPKGLWVQVSVDLCGPFPTGELVLVVLDAYSRYPEIEFMKSISAETIILAFERVFRYMESLRK
jgi:hypothetical protein